MFYKALLSNDGSFLPSLTHDERIVYSLLLGKAVTSSSTSAFSGDGKSIEKTSITDMLEQTCGYLPLDYVPSISYIHNKTNIAIVTLKGSNGILSKLEHKYELIKEDEYGDYLVYAPMRIIEGGYMQLYPKTKLKGFKLVLFSYLIDRLRNYNSYMIDKTQDYNWHRNHIIDTWSSRIAQDFGVKKRTIQNAIQGLVSEGYIERIDRNTRMRLIVDRI